MKEIVFEPLKFEDSFVTFLDILGFSDLVFSDDKDKLQKIHFYLQIVEKYLNKLKGELEELNDEIRDFDPDQPNLFKLNFLLISDSIIIAITQIKYNFHDMNEQKFYTLDKYFNDNSKYKKRKKKKEKEKDLYLLIKKLINFHNDLNKQGFEKLCEAIENIQKTLAYQDIWLRGAITSGTVHISTDNKQIVGKAYINAYKLESKAIYPRVIIDEEIIQELYYQNEEEFIKSTPYIFHWDDTIGIEKDIPLFIDYLKYSIAIPHNREFVNKIFENILVNYEKSKGKSYHDKYSWLLDYVKVCLIRGHESYKDLIEILEEKQQEK